MDDAELKRLSDFLRESLDNFMGLLDIEERTSPSHEDRVHFEEWARYLLVTSFLPDVLAVMCGIVDYDPDLLNKKVPSLIEHSLSAVPHDSAFIAEVMSRLPDHPRMALRDGFEETRLSLADEARQIFEAALYITLNIEDDAVE